MLSDVWVYDIAENWWMPLPTSGTDGMPDPRGWFDADIATGPDGQPSIIVHGGLGENNKRLTDVWQLSFQS